MSRLPQRSGQAQTRPPGPPRTVQPRRRRYSLLFTVGRGNPASCAQPEQRAELCRSSTDAATATPSTAEPRLRPRRCAVTAVELVNESYSLESPAGSGFVMSSENTPFSFLFSFSVGKFSSRKFSGSPSSAVSIVVAARAAGAQGRGPHQGGRMRAARAAPRAVHTVLSLRE